MIDPCGMDINYETTDAESRFIANVIIKKLNDYKAKPFLLNYEQLHKCN